MEKEPEHVDVAAPIAPSFGDMGLIYAVGAFARSRMILGSKDLNKKEVYIKYG